jgi:TRAP-type transport system periplasmic protein
MTDLHSTLRRAKGGIVGLAAVAALTFGSTMALAADWDLPLAWPDGNFHVKNAKVFAAEVKKATGGDININIHAGGSLGFKGPEMMTVLRDGLVPIGDFYLGQQVGEVPIMGLEGQPYLVDGIDGLKKLYKFWRPELDKKAKEYNMKILYQVPWPRQYVYTKVPVSSVADLKGIKIRTYSRSTTALFNKIGMTAVQLPWGEVVPSLAAGTIDAVTTSASSGVDGKFWEFLKFMYPTSHVWGSNIVAVNLDAWNGLKPATRKAILEVAARLEPTFWDVSRVENADKAKILNDNGVAMGKVSGAMMNDMQTMTSSILDDYIKETGPSAARVIKAFKAAGG